MIEVEDLGKTYRVHRRQPGLLPALKAVFHRRYELVRAVAGLSFQIARGERVGFLGPNGAGKTTTLKILSGLLHPSNGRTSVGGFVPQERHPDFLRMITLVMGQKQQLLWDLPPSETFAMNRAIFDVPRVQAEETVRELSAVLEIGDLVHKPTRQLSLGERMKCELVAALLHRPQVLFLDEPTLGLDVSMQAKMREFIREYNERTGATILLTSHYMDDVTALCPRIVVIDRGRLIYDGDRHELVRRVRPDKRLTLRFGAAPNRAALERLAPVVEQEGLRVVLTLPGEQASVIVREVLASFSVADMTLEDPPLEEVLRELFANGTSVASGSGGKP